MQSVVFTAVFERHAKDAGLTDDELMAIATRLAESPLVGDLIPGTGAHGKRGSRGRAKAKAGVIGPSTISAATISRFFC